MGVLMLYHGCFNVVRYIKKKLLLSKNENIHKPASGYCVCNLGNHSFRNILIRQHVDKFE